MKELAVFIDNNSTVPAYEQIYMYIREEIKNGRLKCGDSLPGRLRNICISAGVLY